jgi:NADH-quinone oxidoreductase subunit D
MNNPNLTLDLKAITPDNKPILTQDKPSRRAASLNRSQFLAELKQMLGMEFIKDLSTEFVTIYLINRARIRDVAEFMKKEGYYYQTLIISDFITYFELNYVYRFGPYMNHSQIIIQTQIDRTVDIPSLADYFPNATYQELQAHHRLGANFSKSFVKSTIDSKKDVVTELDVLCVPVSVQIPSKVPNPTLQGIFHPIHKDRSYFDLNIVDGIIQKVELADGWLYENAHSKLENRNAFNEVESVFESLTSNSVVHLSLAYYQGLENIMEKKVPNKSRYIRMLLAELERIRSHLLWFTNFAYLLGYDEDYCRFYNYVNQFELQNETAFKSKILKNTIKYGSSSDIPMTSAASYLGFLKNIGSEMFTSLLDLSSRNFTIEKSKGIGKISSYDALAYGLSGPVLRGTGIAYDNRAFNPYLSYIQGDFSQVWNVIAFDGGDIYARTKVRLWELRESIELSKNILAGLSNYEIPLQVEEIPVKSNLPDDKQALQTVESPQGALSVYIRTAPKKSNNVAYTVRILTPDVANYAALERKLLIHEEIRNLPTILHSLDINYHMVDL